ncbi:acyl-CoA-binding protein [Vallicoccus soli]|uniref:Acyl-CoA-binding protein n=1 Tax=Vallicoccus soli TaxID=2339232 RepID=A0A3A3YY43_9ACTN|nr:acyl-CoA-binding protein [Vallicoccus soli]RJK94893.1 acyl-CoA-binding protein [Vallicoccus soli]
MALQEEFDAAVAAVGGLARDPGNDVKLRLYALYKQATAGDPTGRRPGLLDPVGRAKHDAWAGAAGTSREDAQRAYVDLVADLTGG